MYEHWIDAEKSIAQIYTTTLFTFITRQLHRSILSVLVFHKTVNLTWFQRGLFLEQYFTLFFHLTIHYFQTIVVKFFYGFFNDTKSLIIELSFSFTTSIQSIFRLHWIFFQFLNDSSIGNWVTFETNWMTTF